MALSLKKIAEVSIKSAIMLSSFLAVFLYMPVAGRILNHILGGPGWSNGRRPILASARFFGESFEAAQICFGIMASLLICIGPPAALIYFAWKAVRKVKFRDRAGWRERKESAGAAHRSAIHEERPGSPRQAGFGEDRSLRANQSEGDEAPEPLVEISARSSARDFLRKGEMCHKSGKYGEAIEAYTRAIDLEPTGAVYFRRAAAFDKIGRNEQVLKNIEAAAKLGHRQSQALLSKWTSIDKELK